MAARGRSGPREVTRYIRELRPILTAPRAVRRGWIRDVGLLIEQGRTGDRMTLARQAGRYGRDAIAVFRDARRRLGELDPPPECAALHSAIEQWIVRHVEACEALIHAEEERTLRGLRSVQERLADARVCAQRFNGEYARVLADLRGQVERAADGGRQSRGGTTRRLARVRSFFGRR
jgi:hypothetical protein